MLLIDTAQQAAFCGLYRQNAPILWREHPEQKDHSSFLQPAILDLLQEAQIQLKEVSAVVVNNGPGSYTGLRVGLATAKGICFATGIPLICLSSTETLSLQWLLQLQNEIPSAADNSLIVPDYLAAMIDARRMEVFTTVYPTRHFLELKALKPLKEYFAKQLNSSVLEQHSDDAEVKTGALILEENSYENWLTKGKVAFIGSGAEKWEKITPHPQAMFPKWNHNCMEAMAVLAQQRIEQKRYDDLAYSEPNYVKEFYSPASTAANTQTSEENTQK